MQILGISLVTMAVISVGIFEFAIKGGVTIAMESGHVTTLKGEEYEIVLAVESRGTDWIGSTPTTFKIETGQLIRVEPASEGKMRLRFLGKYAGRTEGVKVGISLADPLKLMRRLQEVVRADFVLDTLPLSLLAPVVPRRLAVFGFGEQPTGYPGQGQELYGLDEYHYAENTKDIIWKRVAKSADETLIARVREADVRDAVRVGVVQLVERGEDGAAWTDMLCEALGRVGREVFEMGASLILNYYQRRGGRGEDDRKEARLPGVTSTRVTDVNELAEAVMSCSVASPSQDVGAVVANSDFVVTGLRELEDEKIATVLSGKPLLLIHEQASADTYGAVIWTGNEDLFPLIRKMLER